ncbi:Hpt domain-containing protein [Pseudoalteromonas sp. SSM20]|uniref:Hpt domain-containing protein n=1 Tax=Pseudoalteromonas sp. SSM20 TaxID=3139394 RepID=UPI003BA949FC
MFNQTTIKQLEADVGKEVLAQLFAVFAKEATKLTEQLLACTSLDEECIRLSHSLKSCARSYGADQLGALAETLETLAKNNDASFFNERALLSEIHQATMAALPSP